MVWCKTCGNNVHEQCFGMWLTQQKKQGKDATCVFCRAPWVINTPKPVAEFTKTGRKKKPSTVVNLLGVSEVRPCPAPHRAPFTTQARRAEGRGARHAAAGHWCQPAGRAPGAELAGRISVLYFFLCAH